jgi:hypothetical protein
MEQVFDFRKHTWVTFYLWLSRFLAGEAGISNHQGSHQAGRHPFFGVKHQDFHAFVVNLPGKTG